MNFQILQPFHNIILLFTKRMQCTKYLRVFVSLIIPSNHVKPKQNLKQKNFGEKILGYWDRSAFHVSALHEGNCKRIAYHAMCDIPSHTHRASACHVGFR